MGDLAKSIKVDQTLIADPLRRIVFGVVIGGSGYPIGVRGACQLEFASDKVFIHALFEKQYTAVAISEYENVVSLQLGGRGAITSGGGWIGGGFGLSGIVTGALMASALNKVTTHSSIETIIYFSTTTGELVLFNNQYMPEQLRAMLSPAFTRIEAAHRGAATPTASPIDQLRELGQLRNDGTISEDEFRHLKSSVLKATGLE